MVSSKTLPFRWNERVVNDGSYLKAMNLFSRETLMVYEIISDDGRVLGGIRDQLQLACIGKSLAPFHTT